MKLASKLLLGVIFLFLLAIGIFSFSAYSRLKADSEKEIADFKADQEARLRASLSDYMDMAFKQIEALHAESTEKSFLVRIHGPRLKNVVDAACAIAESYARKAKAGALSLEQAQSLVLDAARAIRFDGDSNYIWVLKPAVPVPMALMHPTDQALDGKPDDRSDIEVEGAMRKLSKYCVDAVGSSPSGEAFVKYMFPKPGKTEPEPKIAYFKEMKDWGWIFCAGIYMDSAVEDAKKRSLLRVENIRFYGGDGFFWISDLGRPIPRMILNSAKPELNGKLCYDQRYNCVGPARENLFVAAMAKCERTPGSDAYIEYFWPSSDGSLERRVACARIFKPYGWLLCTSIKAAPFIDEPVVRKRADNKMQLRHILGTFAVSGVLLLLLCSGVLLFLVRRLVSSPIRRIDEMAKLIAGGDIRAAAASFSCLSKAISKDGEIDERLISKDETGSLIRSTVSMARGLNDLLRQAQLSTLQLASSATELAASSRRQESSVHEFGATTSQIAASSKEISATSQQLVSSMNEVSEVSGRAAGLASEGQGRLSEMESMMKGLSEATDSIGARLSIINEKANNINAVVAAVAKVADQTNLLSLNAAIEAEKAGEFGKGFAVVAREVRRLADQTAFATLDISRMVKEMQSAVSSGVMEMDKFSESMRRGVKEASAISGQIVKVIEDVQSLPPVFDNVAEGMRQQSSGAQQISEAMVQLSSAVEAASTSIKEFNEAVAQMNGATKDLQTELSVFKVVDADL